MLTCWLGFLPSFSSSANDFTASPRSKGVRDITYPTCLDCRDASKINTLCLMCTGYKNNNNAITIKSEEQSNPSTAAAILQPTNAGTASVTTKPRSQRADTGPVTLVFAITMPQSASNENDTEVALDALGSRARQLEGIALDGIKVRGVLAERVTCKRRKSRKGKQKCKRKGKRTQVKPEIPSKVDDQEAEQVSLTLDSDATAGCKTKTKIMDAVAAKLGVTEDQIAVAEDLKQNSAKCKGVPLSDEPVYKLHHHC